MGREFGGTRNGLAVLGTATGLMAVIALLAIAGGASMDVGATTGPDLPDLVVEEVSNITEVYQGEDAFFNVSIRNLGTAAYLTRTSGVLEVHGYRDGETEVATIFKVFWDIYRGGNIVVNLKVRFDTQGDHTLRVVLDPSDMVDEINDDNNAASTEVHVVPNPENRSPHANGGNDRFGYLGEPMLFSARYSEDPDNDALSYSWVFGDGAKGSGRFTNHTYIFVGDYGSSLMVSDGEKIDIDIFIVHVIERPVNNPPLAVIKIASGSVHEGKDLMLDGSSSFDPDFDRLVYDWDLDASDGVDDLIRGAVVAGRWDKEGAYTVTLMVTDGRTTSKNTTTIIVTKPPPPNVKPIANAGPEIETEVGKGLQISGSGNDPDGFITKWEWDLDMDGIYDTFSEADGTLYHSFTEPGLYTLKLRVTDNRGGTSTDSITVKVEKAGEGGNDSPGPGALLTLAALTITSIGLGASGRR